MSLMKVWVMTGCPALSRGVWNVMFRMIRETVLVGTRTESAMKPTRFISGSTSSRALAEPVVERMMLFMTDRFLRRSLAPVLGTESRTLWVLVAAWMVDMEAVRMQEVSLVSSRGFIMCASPVVVQEAAEMTWCWDGSN